MYVCIYNLWKAYQVGSNNVAVQSVTLYIATHTLAAHGSSSALHLQWQRVCKVSTGVFRAVAPTPASLAMAGPVFASGTKILKAKVMDFKKNFKLGGGGIPKVTQSSSYKLSGLHVWLEDWVCPKKQLDLVHSYRTQKQQPFSKVGLMFYDAQQNGVNRSPW